MTNSIITRTGQSSARIDIVAVAYRAARDESHNIHLPIAQRLAARDQADALRVEWRQLRDERDSV